MRKVLVFAALMASGCATTSGASSRAAFNAWNGASSLQVSCAANPALCAKVQEASVRYTRSGPIMPY